MIGIGNFDLGRDRAGLEISTQVETGRDRDWKFRLRSRSGCDRDPECLNIFRGKKLLCEVLKINFENHKYS